MDRPITSSPRIPQRTWWYIIATALILAGLFFGVRHLVRGSLKAEDVVLATVQEGIMESTISATGLVKPLSEIVLTSPIATRIQEIALETGTEVKQDALILLLDTEFAQLEYSRLNDELRLRQNNVNRLRLTLEKGIRDIEIDDQIQELQVLSLEAQLKDAQRLLTIGGATGEDVEQAEKNLNIARLEKQKLENELAYRQASIEADVRNEQLQSTIQQTNLQELGKKIKLAQVKSPTAGVITWLNDAIGTQVEAGAPLARIANLSSYYIEGTASDMHTEKIKTGLPVRVRINEEYLDGRVEQILPAVENNTVQFRIALNSPDAPSLRPNMRVDVFVVRDQKSNTRYVSNGRAYRGGKSQKFFVREGDRLVQRELEIGMTNTRQIEILSGARVGDQIVMSDMKRFEDRDVIPYEEN